MARELNKHQRLGMQGKGFITLWLVATVVMALTSIGWHGWLLNDIERLEIPTASFAMMFGVFYLAIGFLLTALCVGIDLEMKRPVKGLLLGGVFGFFLYMVAFALGISFQEFASNKYLLFDFAWQMFEQSVGGLAIGLVYPLVSMPDTVKSTSGFSLESIIKKKTTAA